MQRSSGSRRRCNHVDVCLVMAPHCDDAVLSVGQFMAGRPDCVVVTVMAGTPNRNLMLTTYDANSGFTSAGRAMIARRAEDRDALAVLGATPYHLDFVDHQYREGTSDEGEIADQLAAVALEVEAQAFLGPLGLAHPDHYTVRRAYQQLVARHPHIEAWLYEDLPARILWPEQVPDALDWWRGMGHDPQLGFFGTGPIEVKEEALSCYASQLWALNRHAVLCPERLWRIL